MQQHHKKAKDKESITATSRQNNLYKLKSNIVRTQNKGWFEFDYEYFQQIHHLTDRIENHTNTSSAYRKGVGYGNQPTSQQRQHTRPRTRTCRCPSGRRTWCGRAQGHPSAARSRCRSSTQPLQQQQQQPILCILMRRLMRMQRHNQSEMRTTRIMRKKKRTRRGDNTRNAHKSKS